MNIYFIGCVLGCSVVIIGAFGAHALSNILDDYGRSIYDKAVLYHMFHAIALICIGNIQQLNPQNSFDICGYLFLFGIIFFSGSLYCLAITGVKLFGVITPIGGVLFILGWLILIIKIG